MKLKAIELAGFRGALPTLPIELNGKSLCIYGENGYGKTTIADALELWSSGDVLAFHRDRCGLDAAVHVDADEAVIVVQPEGSGRLRRTLKGSAVSAIEVAELESGSQAPVPDRLGDVEKLSRALEEAASSSTASWNELLTDSKLTTSSPILLPTTSPT